MKYFNRRPARGAPTWISLLECLEDRRLLSALDWTSGPQPLPISADPGLAVIVVDSTSASGDPTATDPGPTDSTDPNAGAGSGDSTDAGAAPNADPSSSTTDPNQVAPTGAASADAPADSSTAISGGDGQSGDSGSVPPVDNGSAPPVDPTAPGDGIGEITPANMPTDSSAGGASVSAIALPVDAAPAGVAAGLFLPAAGPQATNFSDPLPGTAPVQDGEPTPDATPPADSSPPAAPVSAAPRAVGSAQPPTLVMTAAVAIPSATGHTKLATDQVEREGNRPEPHGRGQSLILEGSPAATPSLALVAAQGAGASELGLATDAETGNQAEPVEESLPDPAGADLLAGTIAVEGQSLEQALEHLLDHLDDLGETLATMPTGLGVLAGAVAVVTIVKAHRARRRREGCLELKSRSPSRSSTEELPGWPFLWGLE